MKEKYHKILSDNKEISAVAEELSKKYMDSFSCLTLYVIVPVLVMYVNRILDEAEKKNIKKIYFMARDGYLMYHAAVELCKKQNRNIDCSYFYCSRYSLRMAAYRFFDDSAYKTLFIHSYKLSTYNMLERAGLSDEERKKVYTDISFDFDDENNIMTRSEFDSFCDKVKNSAVFEKIIKDKSDTAYFNLMRYINQEKIPDYERIGIVDLGWTGSMQYTLKKIFESGDIKTEITGFYFGTLMKPPECSGSSYDAWLFNYRDYTIKAWFAHNLTECIYTAPHGMTLGYMEKNGLIEPVLAEYENEPEKLLCIKKILGEFLKKYNGRYHSTDRKTALKLLKQLMFVPDKEEADVLRDYSICDDIGEQYHQSIAAPAEASVFRKQLLRYKFFDRSSADGFYWYYGSLILSKMPFKTLYRYEYFFTRYVISLLR